MIRRYKQPDKKNALSIITSSKENIDFTLTLKLTTISSPTVVRNIYESFRMLGDALLVSKGIEALDHREHLQELFKLKVATTRPIYVIDNLRKLRHNVNYYGYHPKIVDVEDIITFTKDNYDIIYESVKEEIEK